MNLRSLDGSHALTLSIAIVCVYLTLSPVWIPGFVARMYDDARYFELFTVALLLIPLASPGARDALALSWFTLSRIARGLILIFLAGGVLVVAASSVAHFGSMELALQAQLIFLALTVSAAVRVGGSKTDSAVALSIFAGATLLVLKFWLTYVMYFVEGKQFPWVSPFLNFANVRFFSQYQAYSLLIVILPGLLFRTNRVVRLFLFIVAANFWALHWMVGSRATWTGLFAGTVIVLAFARQNRWPWLRSQALVALAGFLIFVGLTHFAEGQPNATAVPGIKSIVDRDQGSINERALLAHSALDFMKDHPIAGIGPGQFGLQPYPARAAHPHNVILQLLSEYGIPVGIAGTALIALLAAYALRMLAKPSPEKRQAFVELSVVASLATGLTDSMFNGNLIMPHSQMLFAVLAGWILGRMPARPQERTTGFNTTRFAILGVAILVVSVTTIISLEYFPLARDLPAWLPKWNPHFWQYGRYSNW